MEGCVNVTKRGLIALCKIDKFDKNFDLGCICELKKIIDSEIMKEMGQSVYMQNIEYLDLSENGVKNIDKGFKFICFKGKSSRLNLKIIDVGKTWFSDKSLQSLSVTENMGNLERIYLK